MPQMRYLTFIVLALLLTPGASQEHTLPEFAVASAHPLATQAGMEILEQGGNAFDAAIAVTSTLAVTEPYASGLGGGGFWLLHVAESDRDVMLDGRETAPLAATRDMYLDADGNPTGQSVNGPMAAGIPGVAAAIVHLSEKYGRLPLDTTLNFAIQRARHGFAVSERYQTYAIDAVDRLHRSPPAAAVFLDNGAAPKPGYILKQPQLAKVLERLRDLRMDGFYRGETAEKLVSGVRQAGGLWQLQDLERYRIKERKPVVGTYKNLKVVSATLPSSGGVVLMQMLNMLAAVDLTAMDTVQRTHVLVEVMRRAYLERALYLGDSDYVEVPVQRLLSSRHAENLFADFNAQQATPSQDYVSEFSLSGNEHRRTGENTSHFSIIDRAGNYVAATLSINYPFGSGFMPPESGVLLNNEMDDFVVKPGHPNLWGLVGSEANTIAAGKRMLSSMSPTFLIDDDRVAILGTPGGSRIISMVLLSTLEFAKGADAKTLVGLPRFHHQFLPDQIQFEAAALAPGTRTALTALGHALKEISPGYGNMHAVIWERQSGRVTAASDARGIGVAQVGK